MAIAPIDRRIGAVCVGVNRPGLLRDLNDAAGGAARFHAWVLRQADCGVDVQAVLLTDAGNGSVSRVQVLKAVKAAVAANYDVLYLYLAGHGITGGYGETLLLSDAANDPNDAVNVGTAWSDALYCGIGHVVIVYDACRSKPNTPALNAVQGGSIFSGIPRSQRKKHVDAFYACALGQSAFETSAAGGGGPPEAFFTNTLLGLLQAPPPAMLATVQHAGRSLSVIPCAPLERFLEEEVPRIAARQSQPFEQSPEVDVLSSMPEYFAVAAAAVPAVAAGRAGGATRGGIRASASSGPSPPAPAAAAPAPGARQQLARRIAGMAFSGQGPPSSRLATERLRAAPEVRQAGPLFNALMDAAERAVGRGGYETHTGITVRGSGVRRLIVSNNPPVTAADGTSPDRVTHWRIGQGPWDARAGSALVEFDDGSGAVVAVMPGFEATLVVDHGGLQALSYAPTRHTQVHALYVHKEPRIQAQRMAAAALLGTAQLHELVRQGGSALADEIRQYKAADPTLGVLAAYAYRLAGEQAQVESVLRYMASSFVDAHLPPPPVPFDVALLAGHLTPEFAARSPGIAPFCPLLSLGWLDLADRVPGLHPTVLSAGRHRRQTLWTTFTSEGVALLAAAMTQGALR